MKLTILFFLIGCLSVSAHSNAQKKISLQFRNVDIQHVIATIEKETNYRFLYNKQVIGSIGKVTIAAKDEDVISIVSRMLKGTNVSYELLDDYLLVIKPNDGGSASRKINGKVLTAEGKPLEGASVTIKGTPLGTATDANGSFTVTVSEDDVLVISFVGYEQQEVEVKGKDQLSIVLAAIANTSEEVIVVGYGTQKRNKVSTAVSSVTAEMISKQPVARIEQVLQGTVPGVLVLSPSGQPGEKPMVRIRGTGTHQNPDPLYVVDGFPVSSIEFINPGDIERIDVQKDAAATAIYGARGANGVVLITTKSGKSGASKLSYDGYYGLQNTWRKVPVLNATQYAQIMNEAAMNAGQTPRYSNPEALGSGTNWQDEVFTKNAPITNHQVSVSGGNDKATYFTSFSYFGQQGIVGGEKSQFERYSIRLGGDQRIQDFLKIGANLNYVYSVNRGVSSNADYGGVLNNAINLDPLTPLYETDPARLNNPAIYPSDAVRNGNKYYGISPVLTDGPVNPLASLSLINSSNKYDRLFGNAFAELSLAKGLKFKSSFGAEITQYNGEGYTPRYYLSSGSKSDRISISKASSRAYTWQIENTLSYAHTFGRHNLELVAGQSALKYTYNNLGASRTDSINLDPNMAYLDLVSDIASSRNNGAADVRALASYFGRVSYDFAGKYLFSAVIRRDGSSRFGKNNPFATFPSVSGGWVISREKFFQTKAVSMLKLRASWGQNGNENIGTNSFPWAAGMVITNNGYTFVNPATGQEYYYSGASLGAVPNPNLKWETSEQVDFGVDAEFFKGKLSVTADYYNKKTKNLLFNPSIPATVGSSAPYVNGGAVQNRGVELGVSYRDKINKDWKYSASVNVAYNTNKVLEINNASKSINGSGYIGVGAVNRMQVGMPIGYFWGYKTGGIFQSQAEIDAHVNSSGGKLQPNAKPGDIKFLNLDGNASIGDGDKTMIGNPNPKFTGGLNLNVSYKQFDLSLFAIGMYGHQLINGLYRYDIKEANMPATYLDRWTPENTGAKYPRVTFADNNGNRNRMSDIYVESGSFTRIKNIQVGYTIPDELVKKARLNSFRIYLAVDNPFTFTSYSGFDPEIGARDPLNIGIDHGVYPQARTIRAGLNFRL